MSPRFLLTELSKNFSNQFMRLLVMTCPKHITLMKLQPTWVSEEKRFLKLRTSRRLYGRAVSRRSRQSPL